MSMESDVCQAELPRYRCHKEVWALKIKAIVEPTAAGGAQDETAGGWKYLSFEDDGYAPLMVGPDYLAKHKPEAGGYYVVYKDGYKSFSPAKAFEDGYTRI